MAQAKKSTKSDTSKSLDERLDGLVDAVDDIMNAHCFVALASGLAESLRTIAATLEDLVSARNSGAIDEENFQHALRNKVFDVLERTVVKANAVWLDE